MNVDLDKHPPDEAVRGSSDAEPAADSPEHISPASEAEQLLKQASPARFFLRFALAAAIVGGSIFGGIYAYQSYTLRRAKERPMVGFSATKVTIGTNARGEEEGPAHEVEVGAFKIDKNEVTVWAYTACVDDGGCTEPVVGDFCNWTKDDVSEHPINCVTHEQAEAFCKWSGRRLPTEVEWEYAAGGADPKRRFPWGDEAPAANLTNVCGAECMQFGVSKGKQWQAMHEYDDRWPTTAPVGSYPSGATPEGVNDMGGNVWEWTASPYCIYPEHGCNNPAERIIRGGSWNNQYPLTLEVTTREIVNPKDAVEGLGFRCAF